jgi:hypothetical protein
MNIAILILLLSFGKQSELSFVFQKKAEVSKRQYSSKAKSSNVHYFVPPRGAVSIWKTCKKRGFLTTILQNVCYPKEGVLQ